MNDKIIERSDDGVISLYPENIARESGRPSVLALSLPKAGSVLLDGIVRMLCQQVPITYVSVMESYFASGVIETDIPPRTSELFFDKGVCYGGFRYYPTQFEIPISESAPAILLVRDPRDMIVSLYFSALKSHPSRGGGSANPAATAAAEMDVDAYAMKMTKMYKLRLSGYVEFLKRRPDTKVFRYEEIIYDKVKWVRDICDHFQWSVAEDHRANIAKHWDVMPDSEQPEAHVRQVHPGNFRNKLKTETIAFIENELADEMVFFNYKPEA